MVLLAHGKSNCLNVCVCAQPLSGVRLFVTPPWAVTIQAPLSMEFSRQENTGGGCQFLLQGIFPTQGISCVSSIGRWILYHSATWGACVFINYFRISAQEAVNGGHLWRAELSGWGTERRGKFS